MSSSALAHPAPARPARDSVPQRRLRSLIRGHPEDAAWVRPAVIVLLLATTATYLWNLTASGDANSFYAAAVQAMTRNWKAFFFGSLDSSNFITVDRADSSRRPRCG